MEQAEIKTRGTERFKGSVIKTEIAEHHEERMSEGERRNTDFTSLSVLLEDKDCNSEYVH